MLLTPREAGEDGGVVEQREAEGAGEAAVQRLGGEGHAVRLAKAGGLGV